MKSKRALPELPRVYVRPELEPREREARRAWFVATCSGERQRPRSDTVDPLWMRLGLRATLISQRAGWVVSSPILSDSLDRHPENDPSLPGPGWLREVYRYRDGVELCVLPGVRTRIHELIDAKGRAQSRPTAKASEADPPRLQHPRGSHAVQRIARQTDLFAPACEAA